ncbi:Uu.00g078930.m01.CDS01 [Anthostomella pinea]|uniref:Uu.00g078930.m01.CDS01 n=1 Tax=Anthostomella pinea TaxID=933095 RepID=A0AAI8YJ73_9PEZI|nr:Uu.00g078930.m01.CDS01 [Anthostomella pinea]
MEAHAIGFVFSHNSPTDNWCMIAQWNPRQAEDSSGSLLRTAPDEARQANDL